MVYLGSEHLTLIVIASFKIQCTVLLLRLKYIHSYLLRILWGNVALSTAQSRVCPPPQASDHRKKQLMATIKCVWGWNGYGESKLWRKVDLRKVDLQKCFASTVTNRLFCPLHSSLIHECIRAVTLLWAGFNVLVQSVTAEGSHRSLLLGVFILTMAHREAHKTSN